MLEKPKHGREHRDMLAVWDRAAAYVRASACEAKPYLAPKIQDNHGLRHRMITVNAAKDLPPVPKSCCMCPAAEDSEDSIVLELCPWTCSSLKTAQKWQGLAEDDCSRSDVSMFLRLKPSKG